jgi:hypothetical protein
MKHGSTKNAFWNVNNTKWRKWCKFVSPFLFNYTYGLPAFTTDTKCPNQVLYVWLVDFHTICAKQGWKRETFQIMIIACLPVMSHIWTKNAFWDVSNRKWCTWCKNVSPLLYNNTYGLPMLTMDTKCPKQVFFVWMFDLHNICAKQRLETWITPNNGIRTCLLDMSHIWTKKAFWDVNNRKWRKWCKIVSISYLTTLKAYLCSQFTRNMQNNYFMFICSIFTLFVLNRAWKRDSLLIIIYVYVCSTLNIVELKTRFGTWITRNDQNGVCLLHLF